VTKTSPLPVTDVEAYAYDAEGNRQVSHLSPAYVTDDADRVLDDGTNAYTWSTDGAMTARTPKSGRVGWQFSSSFDGGGNRMRLDSASASDGSSIGFYYDPLHRLVAHHWPSPRGNDELYYDGPDVVLELRHTASGAQWNRYVHGPGADQPLATEAYAPNTPPTPGTGSQYYYHADGEGSIRLLTDSAGQVANRYDYDSFGRRQTAIESLPLQPYGWKGREWVPGPDIYYNRARFYDPLLGRFMSQDPLGYGGGDFNLYSFAWNNAVNWNDPSGLSAAAEEGQIDQATTGAIVGDGIVATSEGGIASGAEAASVSARTGSAVQRIGARVACYFFVLADVLDFVNAPSIGGAKEIVTDMRSCSAKVTSGPKPKPKPKQRPDNCGPRFASFAEGTLVETATGKRPIEQIAVGDLVTARDEFTGEVNWRPVRELLRRTAPAITHLTLDAASGRRETLDVTGEHPFFVAGKGWLEVRRLEKGDRILNERAEPLSVAEITRDERPTRVYNFEVAQGQRRDLTGGRSASARWLSPRSIDPAPTSAPHDGVTILLPRQRLPISVFPKARRRGFGFPRRPA